MLFCGHLQIFFILIMNSATIHILIAHIVFILLNSNHSFLIIIKIKLYYIFITNFINKIKNSIFLINMLA